MLDSMADIVIRGGLIVDGTKAPPYIGDVAITGGKISAVGKELAIRGVQEIDANRKVVAPAWVDCHTHLDAQVTWDPYMSPATTNGTGTVIFGNCGCGFAPCLAEDRNFLIGASISCTRTSRSSIYSSSEDSSTTTSRPGCVWCARGHRTDGGSRRYPKGGARGRHGLAVGVVSGVSRLLRYAEHRVRFRRAHSAWGSPDVRYGRARGRPRGRQQCS